VLNKPIVPLLTNCTFLASGIPVYDEPKSIGTKESGDRLASRLGSSFAVLMRGSGLVVAASSIEDATLLSILIEKAAKVQYMATMLGEPRAIEPTEFAKFGEMPKHFLESSWEHYASKASSFFANTDRLLAKRRQSPKR
jgi:ribulose-5-phosphate 4-epimerase/fuculose-1-phosphate aldolase